MRSLQFHEKFPFDKARLATLIRCLAEQGETAAKAASAYMGVGEPAAKGSLGWFVKTGLGKALRGKYTFTALGALLAEYDPELSQRDTLWLLHYYLVSEHEERAELWYRAFNEFLVPGARFTRLQLQVYMEQSVEPSATNTSYIDEDSKKFVGIYTAPTALGKLDLVHEVAKGSYEATLNSLPEPHIFAFILFDAWQRRFPHADTMRVTQICAEPELPGKVFAARRDQIVQLLQTLQSLGLVNIVDSQHEPVTRRFREAPHQLLANFYTSS